MSNIDQVEDVFGKEVARLLEQRQGNSWTIKSALTTDFTKEENNPPSNSDYRSRAVNTRVYTTENVHSIITKTRNKYGMSSKPEAIKKLLRYGIQTLSMEMSEEKSLMKDIEDISVILNDYISGDTKLVTSINSYSNSSERASGESEQTRILWCQKAAVEKLSEGLDMKETEIIQLSILYSGKALGRVGDISNSRVNDINKEIKEFDLDLSSHKRRVNGGIIEAMCNDQSGELLDELNRGCPEMLSSFIESHEGANSYMEQFGFK